MTSGPRLYAMVYAALLFLLGATFVIARVDLGAFNTVAALAIAWLKMGLVVAYFMHLRDADRLDAMLFASGFVMLLFVLLALTLGDYFGRVWLAG